MFAGISRKRLMLYGGAIVALAALNLLTWEASAPDVTEAAPREAARLSQMAELHIARDMAAPPPLGARDLFIRRPVAVEATVAAPVPETQAEPPPPPDPRAAAIEQARRELADLRLVGVMSAGESSLAVLYHNGNTTNWAVGDEVLPGYRLDRITRDDVQLRNETVGVAAVLSIGGRRPLQLIRVD